MKLVIAGPTGFLGRAVLDQALRCPSITSILTLGRRPIPAQTREKSPDEWKKVTEIVMPDGLEFSNSELKQELKSIDAVIWTIAVTPSKARTTPWEEVKKVSYDWTIATINALIEARKYEVGRKAVRFLYVSGFRVSRNWDAMIKGGFVSDEYFKMRGIIEVDLVNIAQQSSGTVEVCCARPGYIEGEREVEGYVAPDYTKMEIPRVDRREMVAVMLKSCVEGFVKDPLLNDDLVSLGREALKRYG